MRAVDIIIKKRDHQELSQAEIAFFVEGITSGEIPDYQAAAWAMAVLAERDERARNYRSDPGDGAFGRSPEPVWGGAGRGG